MIDLGVEFSPADVTRFSGVMDRLVKECGWAPSRAGSYAMISLLKSIRASTRRSPKLRKIRTLDRKRKGSENAKRRFEVENFKNGEKKPFIIFASSLAEAKQTNFAKIHYCGLARASVGWMMRDVFNQGPRSESGIRKPAGVIAGYSRTKKGSYSAMVENRLHYIRKALHGGGSRAVETAVSRATNAMVKKIENDLMRAAK